MAGSILRGGSQVSVSALSEVYARIYHVAEAVVVDLKRASLMEASADSFSAILAEIISFRDERDWAQFHTPRNLAAALSVEAAEIQQELLWLNDSEVVDFLASDRKENLAHEIADVLIYALLLADGAGIDPGNAIRQKLALNREKYPADISRGRATKYDRLQATDAD